MTERTWLLPSGLQLADPSPSKWTVISTPEQASRSSGHALGKNRRPSRRRPSARQRGRYRYRCPRLDCPTTQHTTEDAAQSPAIIRTAGFMVFPWKRKHLPDIQLLFDRCRYLHILLSYRLNMVIAILTINKCESVTSSLVPKSLDNSIIYID